jgi:hypothetical protein
MHRNEPLEPREPIDPWPILSGLLVIVGLVLFTVSFVWPGSSSRTSAWSADQAKEYQAASANLHRLSHEYARTAGTDEAKKVRAELEKARTDFDGLSDELESAISRPKRIAILMRIGGVALAVAGAAAVYFMGDSSAKA